MSMPDLSSYRRLMQDRLEALGEWDDRPLLEVMTLPESIQRMVRFHELQIELHSRHRGRAILAIVAEAEEDPMARTVLIEMLHERMTESEDRWQEMWARDIEAITSPSRGTRDAPGC
jgi:hypothetical protein